MNKESPKFQHPTFREVPISKRMHWLSAALALVLLTGCAIGTYSPYSIPESQIPLSFYRSHIVHDHSRLYYVGGEVRSPNRYEYVGRTTLTKAIQSAGGLTQFSNRRRVELGRRDGKVERYNYDRLIMSAADDPEIFPGDSIVVKRRFF